MLAMSWEKQIILSLKEADIDTVAYLPDSALSDLIEGIESNGYFHTVPVAREEEAVGVLSGIWLSGKRGALICQSSGLVNSFNALGSLNKSARIPFLGFVTHRGGAGDHNLAHRPAEYPIPDLLDTIGVRNQPLRSEDGVKKQISLAAKSAFSMEEPYIMLLQPSLTEE